MQLARELGMTLQQLLNNTTAEELTLWQALYSEEASEREKQAKLDSLVAKAGSKLQKIRK